MEKTYKGTVIGAVKGDITKHDEIDTWVLGADTSLYLDSGVCKAIHKVAGAGLLEAVRATGGRELGDAVITPAFDAPCKTIIHAAVPKWNEGEGNVKDLLFSCYTRICTLAAENDMDTVAMPSLGTGVYAWPLDVAVNIGLSAITEYIDTHDKKPSKFLWVLFDDETCKAYEDGIAGL